MQTSLIRASLRRLILAAALAPALAAFAQQSHPAQPDGSSADAAIKLENYVVSATRTVQDPKTVFSAVTVLQPADLAVAQIDGLGRALARVPGLSVAQTGAAGGPNTLFIRGGNGEHTLFLVDGIRMNTGDATYNNFLGAADLAGLDQIEVLRGPQSTLYGSSALGGVIVLNTASGHGPATRSVSVYGGSFNTMGATAAGRRESGGLGTSVSLSAYSTDNDREFNHYDAIAYTTRAEYRANPSVLLGFTLRGQKAETEAPGSVGSTYVGTVESLNHLSTVYAQWQPSAQLRSRLTYGWYQQEYAYDPAPPPLGNVYDTDYYSRDTRNVLDWQNNWEPSDLLAVVTGLNLERENVTSVTPGSTERYDNDSRAAYALATLRPVADTTLNAGVRYDDFERFGDATTWKFGASRLLPATGTKLRASYGTGFAAPRPIYISGGPFYNPNPTLEPEKSTGWDAGFDQTFWAQRATASVTYFNNRFRELFIYDFMIPGIVNTGKASARGAELALDVTPVSALRLGLSYTYLDARNDTNHRPLIRRPRHLIDAQATWQATPAWLVGAGVHVASGRHDGSTTSPLPAEDYTVVRLFTQYQLPENLFLRLRVENLLDESYEDVRGYPALPLGVFGGVEWRF